MSQGYWVDFWFAAESVRGPEIRAVNFHAACESAGVAPTGAALIVGDAGEHLAQFVYRTGDESLLARYVFDDTYAKAHPEARDGEHLALLHGTLAAKMYDEGVLLLSDESLAASLRWPSLRSAGTRLTRAGGRKRRGG